MTRVKLFVMSTCAPRSHDGKELSAEEGVYEMNLDYKDIQDNLKDCTYTLTLPKGQHKQTGEYKFFAKNKYGETECSVSHTLHSNVPIVEVAIEVHHVFILT